MLRALAFVPGSPLLVDGLGGTADVLGPLRATCLAAIASLGDGPVVVVGPGPENAWYDGGVASFEGFGPHPVPPRGRQAEPDQREQPGQARARSAITERLPPALAVGTWLVESAGLAAPLALAVGPDEALAGGPGPDMAMADVPTLDGTALVVVGEGSACRGQRAPLAEDPRAEAYDRAVADALASGRPEALLALDRALGSALGASGVVPWQVVARLAERDRPWRPTLLADDASLGVAYLVATWL